MKKLSIFIIGVIFIALTVVTTSCKKDKQNVKTTTKPSDQQGSSAADGAMDDVSDFVNNKIGGGSTHRSSAYNLPCGVVYIDSSTNNASGNKIYKMHYGSQTPCGYVMKSGIVTFDIVTGTAFNAAGTVYKITYKNYVVESLANGETVEVNGYITIENVNGGYIWQAVVPPTTTIVYRVRGNFAVTYKDGTVRNKSYFQLRTYASANSWAGLSLSVDGDTVDANLNKIYEIGKTYDGNYSYQTEAINPFVWSNCGTTYAGPYVLKTAHARMNITIPAISPTYIDVQGGYYWNYNNASATPSLVNDCTTNAYKITTVIGTTTTSQYQLY